MAESSNSNILRKNHNANIPNDLLNDLSSRFIINVPEEERVDLIRLCFQIELAHWFYLDFYCEENSKLPKVHLYVFIRIIFGHIPFLQKYAVSEVDTVIADWREYKKAVPTFGAILLDQELKNVLLVQSFVYKASWGFPKGKVNKDELPQHCAIREVLEETGFDITSLLDKDRYLEHNFNDQLIRLYIIPGVPPDATFTPQTRNEIKGCEWFPVNQLPVGRKDQSVTPNLSRNSFFLVIPFVKQLKKWIAYAHTLSRQDKSTNLNQDMDKQYLKQQQLFAQMTRNEYTRYTEHVSSPESKLPRQNKSTYSPPPRMLRQKNARDNDKKKNSNSFVEDTLESISKYHRKSTTDSPKLDEAQIASTMEDGTFSKTWQNFSLDCETLIATFNISLRKTSAQNKSYEANNLYKYRTINK